MSALGPLWPGQLFYGIEINRKVLRSFVYSVLQTIQGRVAAIPFGWASHEADVLWLRFVRELR
jgi:hypothetical protein